MCCRIEEIAQILVSVLRLANNGIGALRDPADNVPQERVSMRRRPFAWVIQIAAVDRQYVRNIAEPRQVSSDGPRRNREMRVDYVVPVASH